MYHRRAGSLLGGIGPSDYPIHRSEREPDVRLARKGRTYPMVAHAALPSVMDAQIRRRGKAVATAFPRRAVG